MINVLNISVSNENFFNKGLELFNDKAPITTENFKKYIESDYFANSIFFKYRVA